MISKILQYIKNNVRGKCYYTDDGDFVIPRDIVYEILDKAGLEASMCVCAHCNYFEQSKDEEAFLGECSQLEIITELDFTCKKFEPKGSK